MLSIKGKIVSAYTVVFGVLITAFALLIYHSTLDNEYAKMDARLESHADKIATELEEDQHEIGFPNRAELDSIETGGLAAVKIRLLTMDRNVVFADSGFSPAMDENWNAGSPTAIYKTTMQVGPQKYRAIQCPVKIEGASRYLVQVAASMSDAEESLARLRFLFLLLIPIGLIVSGAAAYLIASMAFKPILKMIRTAETITATSLEARLELSRSTDEVHALGKALNDMIARIDGALKSQRQFVADASHELRTPLTIMRSELEYAERLARKSPLKQSITTSLAELRHLSSMVNDLLTLARLDSAQSQMELSRIRLDELLIEGVQAVRGVARKKGIRLKVFVEEAVEVEGDSKKLMSVILNLLDNAMKYSAKRGKVSASLTLRREEERKALIVIEDQGPGLPKSEQGRIFRRFYRGAQSRSVIDGSGLGLAIAQRYVELHGGTIVVDSEEGRGSKFTVELPVFHAE